MFPIKKVFAVLLGLNVFAMSIFFFSGSHSENSVADLHVQTTQDLYTNNDQLINQEPVQGPSTIPKDTHIPVAQRKAPKTAFTKDNNPFRILGAYPEVKVPVPFENTFETYSYGSKSIFGLFNDDDYCERVDYYNLHHPENLLKGVNFFTDYPETSVVRKNVIPKIGKELMPQVTKAGPNQPKKTAHLDTKINTFLINGEGFHKYQEIGKNFLCATQMYSRIPGSQALVKKDNFLEALHRYLEKHQNYPSCFNDKMYFPKAYRLSKQEECDTFFNKIQNRRYIDSLQKEPIQYIIKVGQNSQDGNGVYLLDGESNEWLNKEFRSGAKCGRVDTDLIAQAYITNPLLLSLNNKFDFKVYMLIASLNPLMVYYHDGYIRASLSAYNKSSNERMRHFTNPKLAQQAWEIAHKKGTHDGKTEEQLNNNHIWKFDQLQDFLLKSKKVTDKNWLNTYLRPQFKKAMIHIVKMTKKNFWKQSNVYGLFGLDFILDNNLQLWFIEATPNPQLVASSPYIGELLTKLMTSLFEIEYGLYRGRMKRVLSLMQKFQAEQESGAKVDYNNWKTQYGWATWNKFDAGYKPSSTNSFSLIIDESKKGLPAYSNLIKSECIYLLQ